MYKPIAFFGSSNYVIPLVKKLKQQFNLKLIITTEKDSNDPLIAYAITNNINYLSVSSSDLKNPDLLNGKFLTGIVANFGLIIPPLLLSSFPMGLINIHPSLLPKYRGPSPAQAAILSGDDITGITLIKLDDKIDHGPILYQKKESILNSDTSVTLYIRLFEQSALLLKDILNKYLNDGLKLLEQNHNEATFTKLLKKEDGYIDINNLPPKNILDRMIRAYYPWPGVWTKAKLNSSSKTLSIIKLLPQERIQIEGKKPISIKDFLNGYPMMNSDLKNLIDFIKLF